MVAGDNSVTVVFEILESADSRTSFARWQLLVTLTGEAHASR